MNHLTSKASNSLDYLRYSIFTSPPSIKAVTYRCIVTQYLNMPYQFGAYTQSVTYYICNQFRDVVPIECVAVHRYNSTNRTWTKSSDFSLQKLKWPSLQARRNISFLHNILHKRVSIAFTDHSHFSMSCTQSHYLIFTISLSSINP